VTAEEKVKAKWPDAESTYGTFSKLGIKYWIEDISGEDLSGGKVFHTPAEAWEDAASRIGEGRDEPDTAVRILA